jgi:hypothetical protein
MLLVAARGGEEFSGFPPRRGFSRGGDIHVHVGNFLGNEEDARELGCIIYDQIRIEDRRTF